MTKRFKILKAVVKTPSSVVNKYKDYISGKTQITRTGTELISIKEVFLHPFGLEKKESSKPIRVKMSERAFKKKNDFGANDADLGLIVTPPDDFDAGYGFDPAKMIVFFGTDTKSETSKITGRRYKKRQGASYTIPFGQTTTNKYYVEQVAELTKKCTKEKQTINFKPEIFYI